MSARETERFHNEEKLKVGAEGMKAAEKKRGTFSCAGNVCI